MNKLIKKKIVTNCVILCAIFCWSCELHDDAEMSAYEKRSLKAGSEDLSLVGTKWKCVGVYTAKRNKLIKVLEPEYRKPYYPPVYPNGCEDCFTIRFHTDSLLDIKSSPGGCSIEYEINYKKQIIRISGKNALCLAAGLFGDGNYYQDMFTK